MAKTTFTDLQVQFQAYVRTLQTIGYPTDSISLERIGGYWAVTDKDGKGAPGVVGNGLAGSFVGNTAYEAYVTLQTIRKALDFATTWSVENFDRVNR